MRQGIGSTERYPKKRIASLAPAETEDRYPPHRHQLLQPSTSPLGRITYTPVTLLNTGAQPGSPISYLPVIGLIIGTAPGSRSTQTPLMGFFAGLLPIGANSKAPVIGFVWSVQFSGTTSTLPVTGFALCLSRKSALPASSSWMIPCLFLSTARLARNVVVILGYWEAATIGIGSNTRVCLGSTTTSRFESTDS